jgi:hypothetical protein
MQVLKASLLCEPADEFVDELRRKIVKQIIAVLRQHPGLFTAQARMIPEP